MGGAVAHPGGGVSLVIVRLERRGLVWVNVTPNPTGEWIARQLTEVFPWDEAPCYLIRDLDRVYGATVTRRLRAMGIRDKPIAPGSPWQNGFAERLIASICRKCTDHVVALGEGHLRRILQSHARYYNESRSHRSLNKDAPVHRAIENFGAIMSRPVLDGLHHRYCRLLFSVHTGGDDVHRLGHYAEFRQNTPAFALLLWIVFRALIYHAAE
jgi:hypothetical protein